MSSLWEFDKKYFGVIGGVDEVGRGPLVGNVVAACVSFPKGVFIDGLNDSKKLSPKKREILSKEIVKRAYVSIGKASALEIDQLTILQASFLAMRRAIESLQKVVCDTLLVDGNKIIPAIDIAQEPIVKGDSLSATIAASSIVAKVTRDEEMLELAKKYPEYGFESHKGYPTQQHAKAILKYGLTPYHRKTFRVPSIK